MSSPLSVYLLLGFIQLNLSATPTPKVTLERTPDNGIQPQAVRATDGTVHLIYYRGEPGAGDVFYTRRNSDQTNFSEAIRVNSQAGSAISAGSIRGAQLAVGPMGRVHVVWDGMGKGARRVNFEGKAEVPLLYTRLNDRGTAFEAERNAITYAYGLDGGSSVAADDAGNVYVMWHASPPGNTNGEAGRALFIARSTDGGRTFSRENQALDKPLGACACCGMKSFADAQGNVLAFYRAATAMTNRDETLLVSRDHGASFEVAYSHGWKLPTCPMSSAFLSQNNDEILAAGETHGRVFYIRFEPKSGKVSEPISPEAKAKHPVVVANAEGQILFAWTEGTGWAKGGSVAWQVYDRYGQPTSQRGRAEGVPAFSLITAFAKRDGEFVIIY